MYGHGHGHAYDRERSVLACELERRDFDALAHLIASGKPLAEVASLCGFKDQSQLTRMFTRRVGLSPAGYRRTL